MASLPDRPRALVAVPSVQVPRVTAVFGGGGPFGIAYAFGVVDALIDAGLSLQGSQLLGTSAGAWVAACIASGTPFEALCDLAPLRVPNLRPGLLQATAEKLFGDASSPLVRASAVRLSHGRRVILSGIEHRLADMVAASSSVPWLFAPTHIKGRRYLDGGVRSLVSADHAPAARHLLVIAPIAGPMFGRAGRTMELLLKREIGRWEHTTGGEVHLIRPNRAIASLARHPLDLFDTNLAKAVYPLARQQADQQLDLRDGMAKMFAPSFSRAA